MDHEHFQRVEKLFQAAADLPAEERNAFLDRESGGDPDVRAQVEAMLAELEDGDTLESPAAASSAAVEGPGSVLGRYKLLEVIGEGGFGVVYLAEQRQPVRRKVALKILKLGMDSKEVIARFEGERQALALMDHPSIAKVLDGGMTATGRPYFVMELVRGIAITEYCDQDGLGVRERLELFVEVCLAVQHAHQKGVIHRDLKPSNVLVTLYDGRPVPKVIDFGIAKAIDTPLTEKTLFTRFHRFLGTPAYMSPEQAEMSALDVDTRSDIYSLGVLLYELLTGTTPFTTDELWHAGLSEIRRVLREVEPQRPSARISTTGDAAIARRRQLDVRGLSRWLAGDLDWIVMKALAKERVRRYPAASDLAADLRRHLADEPVAAGPPSNLYRLRKFIARNSAAVASALLLTVALVAGVATTSFALFEASEQRDTARREAEHARAVTDFLTNILALSDPEVALKPDVSVRTLLDRSAAQTDNAFESQPLAEARVRSTIGRAYSSLGEEPLAELHLRRAVDLFKTLSDAPRDEHYTALWSLTHVLFQLDRDDAYAASLRAREVGLAHIGLEHPRLAAALERFYNFSVENAGALDDAPFKKAHALFAAAVAAADAAMAPGDPRWPIVADTFAAAGLGHWYTPREAMAEPYFTKALEIRRRELGAEHPLVGKTLGHLVRVLRRAGKIQEAKTRIREAIAVFRSAGLEGYYSLAFAESLLGEILVLEGRYAEAETLLLGSHEVILETIGSPSRFLATDSFARLITLYSTWGQEEKAAPYRALLAESFAAYKWPTPWPLARFAFGPEHAELKSRLARLDEVIGGVSYGASEGRTELPALGTLVDGVIALRRSSLPERDPRAAVVARTLLGLLNPLAPEASPEAQQRMGEEALRILRAWREEVPLVVADALAQLCERTTSGGERYAREAWALLENAESGDHWLLANTRVRVGRCLLRERLFEEAEALLLPSHAALLAQLGENHRDVEAARRLISELNAARESRID